MASRGGSILASAEASPGCVLDDAIFERDGANAPLARMRQLSVRGSWAALLMLQHHLAEMQPEDLLYPFRKRFLPRCVCTRRVSTKRKFGDFVADGAVLEVRGMTFRFLRLRVHDLSRRSAIRMETEVATRHPPGTVQASAVFRPVGRTGNASYGFIDFERGRLIEI